MTKTIVPVVLSDVYSSFRKLYSRLNGDPCEMQFDVTSFRSPHPMFIMFSTPNGSRGYQFTVKVECTDGRVREFTSSVGGNANTSIKLNATAFTRVTLTLPACKKDWRGRFPYTNAFIQSYRLQQFIHEM